MTELTWEKPKQLDTAKTGGAGRGERLKFLIGGLLILGAILYLAISGTLAGARYFITVTEVVNNPQYVGQTVRISGAVLGSSIEYDSENLLLTFTISHIPQEFDDLAQALYESVNNPSLARLHVIVENEPMPDLLQHEAQAILTGQLGPDGIFYATELNLKCPSRFDERVPHNLTDNMSRG